MVLRIVILLALGVAALKQELFELPREKTLDTLHKFAQPCGLKYNVDPEIITGIADASLLEPRNETISQFVYCFAVNGGYITEDGHIVVDRLAGILGDHPLLEDFKQSLSKCNEITKENPIETTLAITYCVAHSAPIRFKF